MCQSDGLVDQCGGMRAVRVRLRCALQLTSASCCRQILPGSSLQCPRNNLKTLDTSLVDLLLGEMQWCVHGSSCLRTHTLPNKYLGT